jgi:hypothetical protein
MTDEPADGEMIPALNEITAQALGIELRVTDLASV